MDNYIIISGLVVGCLLAACAKGQTDEAEKNKDDAVPAELSVQPGPTIAGEVATGTKATGGEISLGPGLQRLADMAMKDLGAKLSLEPTDIIVMQADYVTWRDSGLGCPRPGYQYMQVLTNGSRIMLGANKQVYQYHSGGSRPPFFCEKPAPDQPLPYAPGEV